MNDDDKFLAGILIFIIVSVLLTAVSAYFLDIPYQETRTTENTLEKGCDTQ